MPKVREAAAWLAALLAGAGLVWQQGQLSRERAARAVEAAETERYKAACAQLAGRARPERLEAPAPPRKEEGEPAIKR